MRKMKTAASGILILLVCGAAFLSPSLCRAGGAIPGFYGSAAPKVATPVPVPKAGVTSGAIPGFYGPAVKPPVPSALPQLKPSGTLQGATVANPSQNDLTIQQTQQNAIIDWQTFDIGSDATVYFNQQGNSSWVALNRIWGTGPSLIFGSLAADGRIYLINQNGILFGPGSQINVNSLTASALNIKDNDFINNVLTFRAEDYSGSGTSVLSSAISNLGQINAADGGSVFLIGPRVENCGTINAPVGQIGLAAGTQVTLAPDTAPNSSRTALVVNVTDGAGEVWNREGGQLMSDTGLVGMYGGIVNQDGLIRSVTAVKQNGQIELVASDKITTGKNSVMESPISDSSETADSSFLDDNSFLSTAGQVLLMGLDPGNPLNPQISPAVIFLQGAIDAPGGRVVIKADQRVFLETGGSINVGGSWSEEDATANLIDAQLNSVELRDAYVQKGGLLQGQTISTTNLTGSSVGDISGAILSEQKTALERTIKGGTIDVTVVNGDIIAKQGSTLDFSGGGINYSGGLLNTTKLLSGTTIYDISNAPSSIQYDALLGQYSRTYDRFGVEDSYSGIYYGGASPLKTYVGSFTRGGDAGSLQLSADTVVLGGQLNGTVTQGLFQTNRTLPDNYATADDYKNALRLSEEQGLEIPAAGTLTLGRTSDPASSALSDINVVHATSPLAADLNPDSPSLKGQDSVISAETLNAAGLGSLNLYADGKITTAADSDIVLAAGGSFGAQAGRIEHYGKVTAPAGTITLNTVDNGNNEMLSNKEIFIASGSVLDVSGQRVDNSLAGKPGGPALVPAEIGGGTITMEDMTDQGRGVFIRDGAVVDVSGGYWVDAQGKIAGGDAGTLDIEGPTVMLSGDIRGFALSDSQGKIKGGQITLHAGSVEVTSAQPVWPDFTTADSDVPDGMRGKLIIAGDRFTDTGFTRIELDGFNDITVGSAVIAPSLVKLRIPVPENTASTVYPAVGQPVEGHDDLIRLDSELDYQTGPSAFAANAGRLFPWQDDVTSPPNKSATVTVSPSAVIRMAPAGAVNLNAPAGITMDGTLESPAGTVSIKAGTGNPSDLDIRGSILVNGYNRPDITSYVTAGGYNYVPHDGGQIVLQSGNDVILEPGSVIDISGAEIVKSVIQAGGVVSSYQDAGNAGSLAITYLHDLKWDGNVYAGHDVTLSETAGGSLMISRTGTDSGMNVTAGDIERYVDAGFDDLTLRSLVSLSFVAPVDPITGSKVPMDETIGRKLTLDAPEILGTGSDVITLRAPWIEVDNSYYPVTQGPARGEGRFTLSSNGWIDLNGSVNMSGFGQVNIDADRDIRLTDRFYTDGPQQLWQGRLSTGGDLVLKADRVYPTVASDFTIQSTGGKVTVLPADVTLGGPILSAGGTLTVEAAKGIEVSGTLAAPMGSISLTTSVNGQSPAAGSRIYLGEGSNVTTSGSAMVNYGEIDDNGYWIMQDKNSVNPGDTIPVTLPGKSVDIEAPEVIIKDGATVDVSGGGSLFGYNWQAGTEGSVNPLTGPGRYVIISDRSIQLPGDALYISGGAGITPGVYSLLPLRYAFLPGAIVIEKQEMDIAPGQTMTTKDGYPVVAGYSTVVGTGIQSTRPTAYSVISSAEIQKQGHFDVRSETEGNAGDISVKGRTVIVNGQIDAAALDTDYMGGKISLAAADVQVTQEATALPAWFDFQTRFDSTSGLHDLDGKLTVSALSLSGKGFREIDLGDSTTNALTIKGATGQGPETELAAPVITLNANSMITVESGVTLTAIAETGMGEIELNSPSGTAVIQDGARLHASHVISLNVGSQEVQGEMQVDHSALVLKGTEISFVPDGYSGGTGQGIYITRSMWDNYSSYGDITLDATGYIDPITNQSISGDIIFMDDFQTALTSGGILTLDAARILGSKDGGAVVNLSAPTVNLLNSGPAGTTATLLNSGIFTVDGDQVNIGSGDISFSGFERVNLGSKNDLTLTGEGSLKTGNADLGITASRIIMAPDRKPTNVYIAPGFRFDAGMGAIAIAGTGVTPATTSTEGGLLEFEANTIDSSGVIDVAAGNIKMTATGSGQNKGIFLHAGSQVLAAGTDDLPGGSVTLTTDDGIIALDEGSMIDVSAGTQGDAGSVSLLAPKGGILIDGVLKGTASGGLGGSIALDTWELSDSDMDSLIACLHSGGFDGSLDIRARNGQVDVTSNQTLQAGHIKLTADDQATGRIYVSGTIDASASSDAGTVELYAGNDLNISGTVKAGGIGKGEEDVILSSAKGYVNLEPGGLIDVSGNGTGQGIVHLRALQDGADVKMNLDGTISGASALYAEAVRVYDNVSTIDSDIITSWETDARTYMDNGTAIKSRLLAGLHGVAAGDLYVLPGIEATNSGDIVLGTDLDFNTWRDDGMTPGVLTILATGDLHIDNNLVDHPTDMNGLTTSSARHSWEFNLVAGADLTAADYMSVNRSGQGAFAVADNALVYTESAPIRFSSAGDTLVGLGAKAGYMINDSFTYNIASYDGAIQGDVGRDLSFTGGSIQTATGNINISVGRDLILQDTVRSKSATLGSIRTTGQSAPGEGMADYWAYEQGGSIVLNIGRNVGKKIGDGQFVTAMNGRAWDQAYGMKQPYQWGASYTQSASYAPTAGLATMGGGSLSVRTGGDFLSQAGTFGQNGNDSGDLAVYAGGDVRGRFLNNHGQVVIRAMGNFGSDSEPQVIEAFDSRVDVGAQGNINLGAVVNPTIAGDKFAGKYWDMTYTEDSSLRLKAGGDITMEGQSPFYDQTVDVNKNESILPATVEIDAGGDIRLLNDEFVLAPSSDGNLVLEAGGDILGHYTTTGSNLIRPAAIYVSDMDPSDVYRQFNNGTDGNFGENLTNRETHGGIYDTTTQTYVPLHKNDGAAIRIQAGGDIKNIKFFLPKKAEITSGGDIQDIFYFGQNINTGDLSEIRAAGNILFSYDVQGDETGFEQSGPGGLFLEAGNSIDLGTSGGIKAVGNVHNPFLGKQGSGIIVLSGYDLNMISGEDAENFFDALREEGSLYTMLKGGSGTEEEARALLEGVTTGVAKAFIEKLEADAGSEDALIAKLTAGGDSQDAAELLDDARNNTIAPLLGPTPDSLPGVVGDLNMTSSQISTLSGKSDIFVFAKGALNVGRSVFSNNADEQNTGIITAEGGNINIFANGDVNVNESRVMTFFGGDITVWSDGGDVNAGRGSKTAVNATPPKRVAVLDNAGKIIGYQEVFVAPAVGSGIRAVTYDPDGAAGPLAEPPAGDIYLFAARGKIDAAEAGISGGKIILGATQVVNVQNISFSAGSIGVSASAAGAGALGNLSGAGTLAAGLNQLSQDVTGVGTSPMTQASKMLNEIMTKWLDVQVIDFVIEE